MAGPRDIRRDTIRIRREQAKRNQKAIEDQEARRTALELSSDRGSSTDRHRASGRRRPAAQRIREGHRVTYAEAATLDGVAFASDAAEARAREAGLTWEDFAGMRPSGAGGYTAADVRKAGSKKRARADEESKMDRGGSGVEDKSRA